MDTSVGEQHFLSNLEPYRKLLESLNLDNRIVLEFGIGHGELTSLILAQGASVIGYELDDSLTKNIKNNNLVILHQDINTVDFSYLLDLDVSIISNPPYSTVPKIIEVIKKFNVKNYILMIPRKYLNIIPADKIEIIYHGVDFNPISRGKHYVVRKGFD